MKIFNLYILKKGMWRNENTISKADILLPENADMSKWAVIACDQYTSEPEYWEDVTKIVGDEPSTLKVTLPEIYLEEDNVAEKIAEVNEEMKN